MSTYGTDDVTAASTVATLRMVNGQMWIDLPDDPGVTEGPTAFSIALTLEPIQELLAALPIKVRDRVYKLVDAHVTALEIAQLQRQRAADEIDSRHADAIRTRAAVDSSRAHP